MRAYYSMLAPFCVGLVAASTLATCTRGGAKPGCEAVARFGSTASMTRPRMGASATLLPNGMVLVAGGYSCYNETKAGDGCIEAEATAELYDPATEAFIETGSMAQGRASPVATMLEGGAVLVAGGDPGNTIELYDPRTGTFSAAGSSLSGPVETATRLHDGRVLLTHGVGAELYDPATRTSTATPDMTRTGSYRTATLLKDGRVLMTGGLRPDPIFDAWQAGAELFDPSTDSFIPTGDMTETRTLHSAVLLPDGTVLVVSRTYSGTGADLYRPDSGTFMALARNSGGGIGPAVVLPNGLVLILQSSPPEIFDPSAGTFSVTAGLIGSAPYDTAVLLADGRALLVGMHVCGCGSFCGCNIWSDAELYMPTCQ